MSFGLNQIVGDYECLGIADKPRVGLTYKVRNRKSGEIEWMRALPGASADDPESRERLLREIRIHARLTHPNLVAFRDAFELEGRIVMTTDYVEGTTLAQRCSAGPLPPDEAAHIVIQVLSGLHDAHELGIVHRGITADHVILCPDGAIKLGGFDLAKPASDTNLTKVGAVIGDPRYIAPEQIAGAPADARSDLYSVGVVLYFALTGKAPFDGLTDFDILSAQVGSPPPPPRLVNPEIPEELEAVVLKALDKKPENRFANGHEFESALAAAANGSAPAPAVGETALPSAAAPARRRLTGPVIAGAAAAVVAVAAGIWMFLR